MAEDADRAAKAARAKALLKKRQAKKSGASVSSSSTPTLISPPESRAFSPAPSEPTEEDRRDLADVFSKDNISDTSWLSLLPKADVRPHPMSPSPPNAVAVHSPLISPPVDHRFQTELASLREENSRLRADLQGLNSELQNTRISANQEKQHALDLDGQIRALNESNTKAISDYQQQISKLQSERDDIDIELRRVAGYEPRFNQVEELLRVEQERSKTLEAEKEDIHQTQQQTISLLVSEKTTLTAELERLEDIRIRNDKTEAALNLTTALLAEKKTESTGFQEQVVKLQVQFQEASSHIQKLKGKEKELSDKSRDQERQIQIANNITATLRKDVEKQQAKVRELEEHIEGDDRAEQLELSLKNTQERADELEFQLSKLKQSHSTLKEEHDSLRSDRNLQREAAEEWKNKHVSLSQEYSTTNEKVMIVEATQANLIEKNASLQSQLESTQAAIAVLQEKLTQAAAELVSSRRQTQSTQAELTTAKRRAEDAESTQKDLQSEGTTLMRTLDEMRPKLVELTGVKLALTEKGEALEREIKNRDAVIGQLESTLDELRVEKENAEELLKETLARHEKEHVLSQSSSSELQKAYDELQEELDASHASVQALEKERAGHLQDVARRFHELERLTQTNTTQGEELDALRQEIDQYEAEHEDSQNILNRAQSEIEGLLNDIGQRDEEIARLRDTVTSPSRIGPSSSLGGEIMDSMNHEYTLELSKAESRVRDLESQLFEAEARNHTLQQQLAISEDHISQQGSRRTFSPGIPSRPSSRGTPDLRRSSFSNRPSKLSALTTLDQQLSPDTRHKRQVSLGMLKARIESENAVAANPGALSPVLSIGSGTQSSLHLHHHRPQFLDDSHVFWCSSCRGDLVIL